MIKRIQAFVDEHNMLKKGDRVVLGVSGGADSVALFHVLFALKEVYDLSLYVVHVNHGIRKEAGEDALYVERLCGDNQIPFFLFEENIPALAKEERLSEEEAGRIYRYRCFREIMKRENVDILALAHHMDDQAETLLFNLARGTDITGAGAMRPVNKFEGQTFIIRPLLGIRKKQIYEWLESRNIEWREDVTNCDSRYSRNRIRNEIIPAFEQINKRACEHFAGFAAKVSAYDEYIEKLALSYITKENREEDNASVIRVMREHLFMQDAVICKRILYEMMVKVSGAKKDITSEHVDALYGLLRKQSGKRLHLPYGVTAHISYEWFIIEKGKEQAESRNELFHEIAMDSLMTNGCGVYAIDNSRKLVLKVWNSEDMPQEKLKKLLMNTENLQKNYTKYFDCDKIGDTLHIRYPKKGDYIVVDVHGHRKKIEKLFKDEKIPAKNRLSIPVIADGCEILVAVAVRRCENYKVESDTKHILEVRYEGEDYGLSH